MTSSAPNGWSTASAGSSWRSDTSRLLDGGGSAFQLCCFCTSATKIGSTWTGGSEVSCWSPQVTSKSTSMLKKRMEMLPVPWAR